MAFELRAGTILAAILALTLPAPAPAQEAEHFAPPVGTEYETHSVTTVTAEGKPDVRTEVVNVARVIRNDGLFSTRLTRILRATTDGPAPAAPPTEFSASTYVTTMAFLPTEVSVRGIVAGMTTGPLLVTRTECDRAALLAFLPLGHTPALRIPCTTVQTIDNTPRSTVPSERTVVYEGPTTTTTPAGTFQVHAIRMTYNAGAETYDLRLLIDTRSGLTPRYEAWARGPGRTMYTVAELLQAQ